MSWNRNQYLNELHTLEGAPAVRHLRYPEAAALDAVEKLVFMEILIKEKSFLLHKPMAVVREMSLCL